MSLRTQTRTTTATGDPVPDNLWIITNDTGPIPVVIPPTKRVQTRETTAPGDPVSDSLWTIISDTGPIGVLPPPPPPTNIMGIIDVQNFSTTDSDATVKKWVDAVKIQCDRDVVPIWGKSVNFNIIPKGGTPTKGNWQCGFFDNSDTAGALGWHDVGPNNEPIIKCFTKTAEGFGESPSVTLSHEVIECIGDADANTTVKGFDGNGKPALLFQELCDMVESSLYAINGVQVSDFVSPAWFAEPDKSGVFDFLKVTKKAWELASGGYEEVSYDNGNTWDQIDKASTRSHLGSHRKAVYHKKPEDRVKSTFEMSA